jgi:hypothetical protein
MFHLINKKTNEIERISDDRIFYDESKYDLIEFDPVDKRKKLLNKIEIAETIEDIKIILKKIVKEII